MRFQVQENWVRKVHLYKFQNGDEYRSGKKFANTLCRMNSDVPTEFITTSHAEVTCKICRRHAEFRRPSIVRNPVPEVAPSSRFRHRRAITGKLVLQISTSQGVWRDAKLSDICEGITDGR